MATAQTVEPTPRKPLRLWPGVLAAVLLALVWYVVPIVVPEAMMVSFFAGAVCVLAVVLWWVFFSRAPWSERLGAVALMIAALAATRPILHKSVATGMMGMMFFMYAIPVLILAFVACAVASRRLANGPRRATRRSIFWDEQGQPWQLRVPT